MSAQKVIEAIKSYSSFLIAAHVNLEGDALGSELALAVLLRKMDKRVYVVNNDTTPANYAFLPGAQDIENKIGDKTFDAVIIVDCPLLDRAGRITAQLGKDKPLINIDHHIDNECFGKINWVDASASSAGEMVYRLFKMTATAIDRDAAENLYTAIVADTGSFHYSNTTGATFAICAELVERGIEPAEIYARVYENNSAQDLAVYTGIVSRVRFCADDAIAYVRVEEDVFKRMEGKHDILDRVLDLLKSVRTVRAIVILSQMDGGRIKLSLRSKKPVDVQKVARIFGGGGHKFASGCVVRGNLPEVEENVLNELKKAVLVENYPGA